MYDINVDDQLRPQSTTGYKKEYQSKAYDFPNIYPTGPIAVMDIDPVSSRVVVQNELLKQRYFNK